MTEDQIAQIMEELSSTVLWGDEIKPYSPNLTPCYFLLFQTMDDAIGVSGFHDSKKSKMSIEDKPR